MRHMPEIKQKSNILYDCSVKWCDKKQMKKEELAKIIISNDIQFCSMNCYANWRSANE